MELSAKYAYEVYKAKSFSAAAKKLYISHNSGEKCQINLVFLL